MRTSPMMERYRQYADSAIIDNIYELSTKLRGLRVVHINTTSKGGGVAELLQSLVPLLSELGIVHSWKVVELDHDCLSYMSALLDALQDGQDSKNIAIEGHERYLTGLTNAGNALASVRGDVYFVHDFQLTPIVRLLPWLRPAVWICHIDTSDPSPNAKAIIEQYLDSYNVCAFNSIDSVFKGPYQWKSRVIAPGIDPFRPKNRELSLRRGRTLLKGLGIDTRRPILTQVSRFGKWKNPWQAIDIYRSVKRKLPEIQLALVGTLQAIDDLQAAAVLSDLERYRNFDPDIHLFSDPGLVREEEINAFQRCSTVILQRSLREGFGLTVTEALWKGQPVIGTPASGIQRQITDGINGFITNDTETSAEHAIELINNSDLRDKLGRVAHRRVRENFLLSAMAMDYLMMMLDCL